MDDLTLLLNMYSIEYGFKIRIKPHLKNVLTMHINSYNLLLTNYENV